MTILKTIMTRAASSVVGTILITGIVITAVTVGGAAMLDRAYGGPERAPVGAVDVAVNGANVAVTHCGGETLARDGVVLRTPGVPIPLSNETMTAGDRDAYFEPGERWRGTSNAGGTFTESDVVVVHTPSNTVLDTTECGVSD